MIFLRGGEAVRIIIEPFRKAEGRAKIGSGRRCPGGMYIVETIALSALNLYIHT